MCAPQVLFAFVVACAALILTPGPSQAPEIQKFVGALHGKRARKGVFITTGSFTSEATAYVEHIDPKGEGVRPTWSVSSNMAAGGQRSR